MEQNQVSSEKRTKIFCTTVKASVKKMIIRMCQQMDRNCGR